MNKIFKMGRHHVMWTYVFNGKVTELMGTDMNFEFKILILNFEFNLR